MANVDVTRIASNIGALNALNSLQNINKELAIHQGRLSTGKRINSAADDPAGLTIATKMLARSEGLKVAVSNIGDANNMLSVAESGLSKMNDILVQMRSKAEQAASDTLGQTERQAIQTQMSAYAEQIDNIVNETKWNGTKLLDGTVAKQFQTGVDVGETTSWTLTQSHGAGSTGLGISTNVTANAVNLGTGVFATGKGVTTLAASQTIATGYSALATGQYGVYLADQAAAALTGKVVSQGTIAGGKMTLSAVAVASAGTVTELVNGTNAILFRNLNTTAAATVTFDYSVDNGTNWLTSAAIDTTGATNTVALTNTSNGAGTKLGVFVTLGAGAVAADLTTQQSASIDYIKAGYTKAQLKTSDGSTVVVNNGVSTSSSFYLNGAAAAAVDTGRGLLVTSDLFANVTAKIGSTLAFGYTKANAYSVDVSSATLASNYMQTVSNAMDTVNGSMASLGSLMARLTFKEDQISTAQVNVEGAYSRIMNANMAEEQMNASKYSILQQTAVAMLAQANQAPQSLLTLFR